MSSRSIFLALALLGCASAIDPVPSSATAISISPLAAVVQVSQHQSFGAFFVDSTGRHLGPATVRWSSSYSMIATIGQTGVATGSLPGATTIHAVASNGLADSAQLVVIPNFEVGDRAREPK
jgi:Bacterial Ig-like domain (group 2)